VKDPVLSKRARAAYAEGAAACAERLTREGVDLAGYSMVETVDDMEAARKALGYERINIFGNSYGTRPQQIYMWRYPQSLHRAVLVAVNPPGHFIWDPYVMDELLGRYGELCAKDEYCRSRTTDLTATMRQVSQNMPRSWMGLPIDADMVKVFSFFMLMETIPAYDSPLPVSGPIAIDMWLDAAEGDPSGMALVSVLGKLFLPKMRGPANWGHFLAMGSSTLDYYDPRRDYENELMPADSILGAPGSMHSWAFTQGWPGNPARHEYNEIPPSDVETLLVSGTLDFSTPARYSRDELAPKLANGHQVTLREFGHTETFWNSQSAARAKLLTRFFDEGAVDTSGYVYQPIAFRVERGWDALAGQLLAIALIVLAVLVALSWLLVRLVRRRRRTLRVLEQTTAA
jgi:pimeloyl-ACP methyl ester carboxylesterase